MDIVFSIAFSGPSYWSTRQTIEWNLVKTTSDSLSGISETDSTIANKSLDEMLVSAFHDAFHDKCHDCDSLHFESDAQRIMFLARSFQHVAGVATEPIHANPRLAFSLEHTQRNVVKHTVATTVAMEFEEEELARECMATALRVFKELLSSRVVEWSKEKRRLVELADTVRLGPSSRAILRAAADRNVPYYRMNCGSLVQLGEGVFQRRIWTAETDATSAIAESIAKDKQFTRTLLASAGVPVPKGRLVMDAQDACYAAAEIGLPVVVKPRDANHARGISLDLRDHESIRKAYDWAKIDGETEEVMVEQYIEGEHHRLLVVGDKMIAAAKGQREYIFGNGRDTIEELVAEVNRDPRRGENYTDLLGVLKLDASALIELNKQNVTPETVLEINEKILVRHVGDLIEDVTARVHPTTADLAILAAKVVGLDIAGMDLVVKDISIPLSEQRGCIIEVNAGPSLAHHVVPLIGQPQPVGHAIVDLLFPVIPIEVEDRFSKLTSCGKIPITLVVQRESKSNVLVSLEKYWENQGEYVGVADHQSIRCGGNTIEQVSSPKSINIVSVKSLLMHPLMTKMVIEGSVDSIVDSGVPVPRADFLVIDTDLFNSDLETAMKSDEHLFIALTACRNAITPDSIIVLSSTLGPKRSHPKTAFQDAFDAIFSQISRERITTLECLLENTYRPSILSL